MPLYEYVCESGHTFKLVRSIHEDEPKDLKCPECQNSVRQVLGGVAIQFKGSGFYRTDKNK